MRREPTRFTHLHRQSKQTNAGSVGRTARAGTGPTSNWNGIRNANGYTGLRKAIRPREPIGNADP